MSRKKNDPISHQVIRALAAMLGPLPVLAIVPMYTWWVRSRPATIPQWSMFIFLTVALAVLVPCVVLQLYILRRYAPERTERTYGPVIPKCKKCGYDCRVSPYRCPECGSRSIKRT